MAGETFDGALQRWRGMLDQDPQRETGTLLPFSRAREGGDLRWDIPTSVREGGQGIIDLLRGPQTGTVTPEASMSLLGMAAPNVMARPNPSELGIFVGPRARTYGDPARRAETLRRAGASDAEAFGQTGVFQGPDTRFRLEIPDTAAKIDPEVWAFGEQIADRNTRQGRPQQGIETRLGDVLQHPDLYRAYPGMADSPVRLHAGSGSIINKHGTPIDGEAWPPSPQEPWGRMMVAGRTPADVRSTLLHEVQHKVQAHEGSTPGANLQMPEVELVATRRQGADYDAARRVADTAPDEATRRLARQDMQGIAAAWDEYVMSAYRTAGGEAESRAVQRRADTSPSMLRAIPPRISYDVPPESLWDPRTGLSLPGWPRR